MIHFGHQKNSKYKKADIFFSSKIFLLLNDHQLSVKEYNTNVTDVSFVKGLIDTKTIQRATSWLPAGEILVHYQSPRRTAGSNYESYLVYHILSSSSFRFL